MGIDVNSLGVLLVEDNPGDADLVREWLDQENVYRFTLTPVTTLHEAQFSLRSSIYDAVLLDLSLPDSQGIETLSSLREFCETVPILVFSGSSSDENRLAAYRAGAQDFIPKSEGVGQLLARAILYAVERYRTQSQQHYLERVMAANPDAVLVVDGGGTVQFVNDSAVALFGRTRNDLVGVPLAFDLGVAGLKEVEIVRGNETRTGEVRVANVEWQRDPASLVIIRDRTDFKRIEAQLRQAQKMEAIGRLAGGIAHDFNNLLTVINGYVEVLSESTSLAPDELEMLECVQQAGVRAAGLTSQLLAFGRRSIVATTDVDLRDTISRLETFLRRIIGEDIELHVSLSVNTGCVLADQTQIEQIIMNLAVNARDAMKPGGILSIETDRIHIDDEYVKNWQDLEELKHGSYARISISDTGAGMDSDTIAKIFEPFFTTKELGKGTGLGLATVYGIVKQMEGDITCYSEVGMGTRFTVYLPTKLGEGVNLPESAKIDIGSCHGTETILLVEDDDVVRQFIVRSLHKLGYEVLEATDGTEALEIASRYERTIQLLLADIVMPKLGGADLASRLIQYHPEARVLYISGYTDDAIIRHGIFSSRVNFLQKPFTPTVLAAKLRQILEQPNGGQ